MRKHRLIDLQKQIQDRLEQIIPHVGLLNIINNLKLSQTRAYILIMPSWYKAKKIYLQQEVW